jgi:hypothetical protein
MLVWAETARDSSSVPETASAIGRQIVESQRLEQDSTIEGRRSRKPAASRPGLEKWPPIDWINPITSFGFIEVHHERAFE